MKCVNCHKVLTAGDITLNGSDSWVVMCPSCDKVQPYLVIEEPDGGGFIVAVEVEELERRKP